jgi:hypothetical protein
MLMKDKRHSLDGRAFTHYRINRLIQKLRNFIKNISEDEFERALLHPDKCYLIHLSPDNLKDLRESNDRLRQEREKAGAIKENS